MGKFQENLGKRMDQMGMSFDEAAEKSEPVTKKKVSRPITWTEFVNKTEKNLDKCLIAHAKKEGLIYVGGKGRFTVTELENKKDGFILKCRCRVVL